MLRRQLLEVQLWILLKLSHVEIISVQAFVTHCQQLQRLSLLSTTRYRRHGAGMHLCENLKSDRLCTEATK